MIRHVSFIAALAALFGCEGANEGDAPACFSIQDCEEGRTCFFGRCVEAGFGLTSVYSEITPPNDSPWLEQQLPRALALDGFQEIELRASVTLSGSVRPGLSSDSLPGVMLVRATGEGVPGRDLVRQTNVTETGFEVEVLPGRLELSFDPVDETKPPKDFTVEVGEDGRGRTFPYPTSDELAASTYHGRVLLANDSGAVSEGARVVGFGVNSEYPDATFRSTVAVTDANGEFDITFLPQVSAFDVRVGPNPGVNELIPEVTFESYDSAINDLENLILGIEFEESVAAVIVDELGNAVRDANVLFEGSVGALDGRFVVEESSDETGSVSAQLLPGDYEVTVAPQKSQPYALVSQTATIPNGNLVVTVQRKVRLAGCVFEDDNTTRVPDAEITLTRLDSAIPRVFRTVTTSDGCYDILVDPGTVDADEVLHRAEYELTVQPGADSGLPFFRELMIVETDALTHDIQLYEPELVYGMVRDPYGLPLANAILAFYSTQLRPDEPILVGVVSTLDGIRAGEFVLPVPVPRDLE
jgi:hypothetical protein